MSQLWADLKGINSISCWTVIELINWTAADMINLKHKRPLLVSQKKRLFHNPLENYKNAHNRPCSVYPKQSLCICLYVSIFYPFILNIYKHHTDLDMARQNKACDYHFDKEWLQRLIHLLVQGRPILHITKPQLILYFVVCNPNAHDINISWQIRKSDLWNWLNTKLLSHWAHYILLYSRG